MSIVLASASPQRRAILEQLGIAFEVAVPDVKEISEGDPGAVATYNADLKAAAVARRFPHTARILAADTVVALDGRILPKPRDAAQARGFLELLSGRDHQVVTAISVMPGGEHRSQANEAGSSLSRAAVRFRSLSTADIAWYLASGEWRERAGAYAVQGRGAALVSRIDGDYWTVVGLPVTAVIDLLGPQVLHGG